MQYTNDNVLKLQDGCEIVATLSYLQGFKNSTFIITDIGVAIANRCMTKYN